MPGAVADLAALGIELPGHELAGIRYVQGDRRVDAPFKAGPGRGVRRTALHVALSDAVAREGVPVERRTVRTLTQDADGVLVDGERARYVIAADGLHSTVRRLVGLEGPRRGRRRFGLRRHLAMTPWTPFVEVHWSPRAEAYVTPVADDCVGVAVLVDGGGDYDDLLTGFPGAARAAGRRARLEGARGRAVAAARPPPGRGPGAPGRRRVRVRRRADGGGHRARAGAGPRGRGRGPRRRPRVVRAGLAAAVVAPQPADPGPARGERPPAAAAPAGAGGRHRPVAVPGRGQRAGLGRHDGAGGAARRGRERGGRRRQVRRAPRGDAAAPGVLLLRARRGGSPAGHPAGAVQGDVPGRVDQHLLRPPGSGRGDRGRRRPAGGPGARHHPARSDGWCCPGFRYSAPRWTTA